MIDPSHPSVLRIMWVTFRLYWDTAAPPGAAALQLLFLTHCFCFSVYQSKAAEHCSLLWACWVWPAPGGGSRVCGQGYHGIKTFSARPQSTCASPARAVVKHTPHVNSREGGGSKSVFSVVSRPFAGDAVSCWLGESKCLVCVELVVLGGFGCSLSLPLSIYIYILLDISLLRPHSFPGQTQ